MSRKRPRYDEQWGNATIVLVVACIAVLAIIAVSQRTPHTTVYNQTYIAPEEPATPAEPAPETYLTADAIFDRIAGLTLTYYDRTSESWGFESTSSLSDVTVLFEHGHPNAFGVLCYGDRTDRPYNLTNVTLTIAWHAPFAPVLATQTFYTQTALYDFYIFLVWRYWYVGEPTNQGGDTG